MPDARSAPTRRELIERLAPLIWQERQREAEHRGNGIESQRLAAARIRTASEMKSVEE